MLSQHRSESSGSFLTQSIRCQSDVCRGPQRLETSIGKIATIVARIGSLATSSGGQGIQGERSRQLAIDFMATSEHCGGRPTAAESGTRPLHFLPGHSRALSIPCAAEMQRAWGGAGSDVAGVLGWVQVPEQRVQGRPGGNEDAVLKGGTMLFTVNQLESRRLAMEI
jgi:hypothetical protein